MAAQLGGLTRPSQTQNTALWVSAPDECDIQAGGTLYRLELGVLAKISGFFRDLKDQAVRRADDVVHLSEFNEPEFEYFAFVAYDMPLKAGYKDLDKSVLLHALELSRFLSSSSLRDAALGHIESRRYEFSLAEVFKICHELPTRRFVQYAFRRLLDLQPRWSSLPSTDLTTIGVPVIVAAVKVQEGVDTHRRLVAGEPPILIHAPACADNARCAEDWRQVWWNTVGRHLMEGRVGICWDRAAESLFRSDFGVMDQLCLQSALDIVKGGDPMVAETRFVNDATEKVMQLFGEAETWEI